MSIGDIANSGMQAAMTDMEVISNNIANVPTIGFKRSFASFNDLYPAGEGGNAAGLGIALNSISQDFSAGAPTNGTSVLSMRIDNSGFFVTSDANTGLVSYTRAGDFKVDDNGFIISNVTGQNLQGYLATNNVIVDSSSLSNLQLSLAPIPATATANVTAQLNLNSNSVVPAATPFDPTNTATYNFHANGQLFDSQGNIHNLDVYYVKTSPNNWSVNVCVDGNTTPVGTGALTFDTSGQFVSATGLSALSFTTINGSASPQVFALNLGTATQFSSGDQNIFTSDGNNVGTLTQSGITIDGSGNIFGTYSNQTTLLLGKVAVAQFASQNALAYNGDMSWLATEGSGPPILNQSNSNNNITSGQLEGSNVDLTTEMISLINAQHNFQANAQVVQVYNEVMQTILQI